MSIIAPPGQARTQKTATKHKSPPFRPPTNNKTILDKAKKARQAQKKPPNKK
jgi:hypothetical protein